MLNSPWSLREAARCVRSGGLIAYPTEAVYGLGCDPLNQTAVLRLLAVKQRPVNKGLILLAAEFEQLLPFIKPLPADLMQPLFRSWPGPVTWLLPARSDTPEWLTGSHTTLAVRVTAHPLAAALCRRCNSPLVSTSANVTGRRPARSAIGIYTRFDKSIDCVVHGAVGNLMRPSSIRDAATRRVLRN